MAVGIELYRHPTLAWSIHWYAAVFNLQIRTRDILLGLARFLRIEAARKSAHVQSYRERTLMPIAHDDDRMAIP